MPDPSTSSGPRPAASQPDWAPHIRERLSSLRLAPTREREIVDELVQHLDDRWRELVSGGATPEQAERLALAEFRDRDMLARFLAPLRQAQTPPPLVPGAPTGRWLGDLWRDVRYAARVLRRQPGFTLTAVVTLALGIGATTAMFTVVDATLLRALPFPQADRLVQVSRAFGGRLGGSVSQPKFLHWRRETRTVFTDLAAYSDWGIGFTLVGAAEPDRLIGALVSAAFFDVMGVRPVIGRGFREDEDAPGHATRRAPEPRTLDEPIRCAPRTSWAVRSRSTASPTRSSALCLRASSIPPVPACGRCSASTRRARNGRTISRWSDACGHSIDTRAGARGHGVSPATPSGGPAPT